MDEEQLDKTPRTLPIAPLAALGGGLVIGLASLTIPNYLLENTVTAYGIAELLPAAAPPLGVTARLLIALGSGLFTASCLYILFSYKGPSKMAFAIPRPSLFTTGGISSALRSLRFGKHAAKEGEIADFEDLPKLRMGDSHPDAPARRPFFAGKDLGAPLTLGLNDALADDDFDDVDSQTIASEDLQTRADVEADENIVLNNIKSDAVGVTNDDTAKPEAAVVPRFLSTKDDEAGAIPQSDEHFTSSAEPSINDDPVPSFVTGQTDGARVFAKTMDDAHFTSSETSNFEKPITDLSICELMERLERGLAKRVDAASDKITDDMRAEPPTKHTADADANESALDKNRNNVHAMTGSLSADTGPDRVTTDHRDERTEAGAHHATFDVSNQSVEEHMATVGQEVPENELDDALKAALETLRIMTDRQKNA